jgi:quercetin dioxygenase-like cupin family protein
MIAQRLAAIALLAAASTVATAADAPATQTIYRAATQAPTKGSADMFTGAVAVQPVFPAGAAVSVSAGRVTFQPGARSAWHTHPAGQYLIVTAGTGWTQAEGGPVEELHEGDAVWCPPGVKHWHGATPTTAMTHIALTATRDGRNVQWLDKVGDAQYRKP